MVILPVGWRRKQDYQSREGPVTFFLAFYSDTLSHMTDWDAGAARSAAEPAGSRGAAGAGLCGQVHEHLRLCQVSLHAPSSEWLSCVL